jgi:hypothetical protein
VTLSLAAVRDHFQGKTKLGFGLRVENFGGVRCDFFSCPFFWGNVLWVVMTDFYQGEIYIKTALSHIKNQVLFLCLIIL